jgi:hypothetical protein
MAHEGPFLIDLVIANQVPKGTRSIAGADKA